MTSCRQLKAADPGYVGSDTKPRGRIPFRRPPLDRPWIPEDAFQEWVAWRRAEKEALLRASFVTERNAREPELRERLRPYGLHVLDYYAMLKEQAGKCAACGEPGDELVVDHCHLTDIVRGLIHSGCNSALGFAAESPHRLRALADYLERTR